MSVAHDLSWYSAGNDVAPYQRAKVVRGATPDLNDAERREAAALSRACARCKVSQRRLGELVGVSSTQAFRYLHAIDAFPADRMAMLPERVRRALAEERGAWVQLELFGGNR